MIFASIVVVCIAFVIVSAKVIIPNQKYKAAVELYTAGKYEEAIAAFAALDGYKDSAAQIETCKTAIKEENYTVAMELYNGGEYKEALAVFVALDGYMDSAAKTDEIEAKYLSDASVGSTVYFGSYEQDNDTSNGKEVIEWLVLAKAGNKVLVISKYALDRQVYNTSNTLVTWENCTLRTWLNDTFYNEAFDADHQKMIVSSTVTTHENPSYITSSGNKTSDKVFLLSVTEATMYFSSNEARKCAPTDYVIAQGTVTSNRDSTGGRATCSWWLRSPGTYLGYIANISFDGHVDKFGSPVAAGSVVRPALWIDLGS